jgi:hypothetical protein
MPTVVISRRNPKPPIIKEAVKNIVGFILSILPPTDMYVANKEIPAAMQNKDVDNKREKYVQRRE